MNCLAIALTWRGKGFMPLPLTPDGSKAPAVSRWRQWQFQPATFDQVERMFRVIPHDGLGLICGEASGNLELFELEGRAIQEGLLNQLADAFHALGEDALWEKISKGYVELSPGGGLHYYYRVVDGSPRGNVKLARRPATAEELAADPDDKIKTLIETRGQGGFVVIAPSDGRSHKTGRAWKIITGEPGQVPTITGAERDLIHAVAAGLDQMPVVEQAAPSFLANGDHGDSPGSQFNERASWMDVLGPHGWVIFRRGPGQLVYWTRPGKHHPGVSASTGLNDHDRLWVFSTSTVFSTDRPYDKFGAFTLLEHAGDFTAAARDLRAKGFGAGQAGGQLLPSLVLPTQPAEDQSDPEPGIDLWDIHPVFTEVLAFAHARSTSGWAVLGGCLLRVLAQTPPWVVLPPIIGGPASLNLLMALVGPSGVGKSSAMAVADEALTIDHPRFLVRPLGSGEGISRSYKQWKPPSKGEPGYHETITDAVIFKAAEVDVLTSLMDRAGATLGSQLKTAFDGDQLGFANASQERRVWLEPHSYRFCLMLGVQPQKALVLFADAVGGTTQRFLWLNALDAAIPEQGPAEHPPAVTLVDQNWTRLGSQVVLSVPAEVVSLIKTNHLARIRGDLSGLDGHDLLVQLKVAQALSLLVGQRVMTMDHWAWAGLVMDHSRQVREGIQQALEGVRLGREDTRARADAHRAVVVQEGLEERAVVKVVQAVRGILIRQGGSATRTEVSRALPGRGKAHLEEALDRLIKAGDITVTQVDSQGSRGTKKAQLIKLKRVGQ